MLPGFSTSDSVTDISGRGVGMDVVKKNINKIQGDIEIFSEKGKGTTFSLKLPLTLSIIDGLLVQIDHKKYIIPILLIKKIAPILNDTVNKAFNNTLTIDQEQIPFLHLREEFNIKTEPPKMQQVVVVNYGDKEVGIVIDRVIRESQVVVKSIGKHFKDQEIISGASIMGDGIVALVLDTNKIIEKYSR
jgi:two-component system chemotaxis sensor kinase CheA